MINCQITIWSILINNTINDKGIAQVLKSFPAIIFIENSHFKGFSANNNLGIKQSNGRHVLLLNPDTYLLNNAFEVMIKYISNNKNIGICGPKILNEDGTVQLSCRKFPTLRSFLFRRTPLRFFVNQKKINHDHLMIDFHHKHSTKVDWMLGACLMISRELINKIGLLDENYFMYCEDIDICYRVKKRLLECHYVPEAKIHHLHQAQSF